MFSTCTCKFTKKIIAVKIVEVKNVYFEKNSNIFLPIKVRLYYYILIYILLIYRYNNIFLLLHFFYEKKIFLK